MFKQEKGVTLVALVITIIVLLILAGVSIAMLTGDNGILTKASDSKETNAKAQITEDVSLAISEIMANKMDPSYTGSDNTITAATIAKLAKANDASLTIAAASTDADVDATGSVGAKHNLTATLHGIDFTVCYTEKTATTPADIAVTKD